MDVDEGKSNGHCLFASVNFVPSYSTAIKCKVSSFPHALMKHAPEGFGKL